MQKSHRQRSQYIVEWRIIQLSVSDYNRVAVKVWAISKIAVKAMFQHGTGYLAAHLWIIVTRLGQPWTVDNQPNIFKVGWLIIMLPGGHQENIRQAIHKTKQ